MRRLSSLLVVSLGLSAACSKEQTAPPTTEPTAAEPAAAEPAAAEPAAEVVPNLEAQPGDTTTCPFSGKPFVVKADHPRVEYEGQEYWVCSEKAAEQVRADPGKYLDGFEG